MGFKLEDEMGHVVKTTELLAGDIIRGTRTSPEMRWTSWEYDGEEYLVTKSAKPNGRNYCPFQIQISRPDVKKRIFDESRHVDQEWLVTRTATRKVASDEDFPSTCTRCGRAAYLGLFEVSHADEDAASDCPARRKA